jgi:hypothetical protein
MVSQSKLEQIVKDRTKLARILTDISIQATRRKRTTLGKRHLQNDLEVIEGLANAGLAIVRGELDV